MCVCVYLVSPPARVPHDVDDGTPTAEPSMVTIVTMARVVIILQEEDNKKSKNVF